MSGRARLVLLILACIWGASFLFIRVAVDAGVSALQIALIRCLSAAVVLDLLLLTRRPMKLPPRSQLPAIAAFSLLATAYPFVAIAWAETRIASGTAAVLNATMPLFTAAFAALILK